MKKLLLTIVLISLISFTNAQFTKLHDFANIPDGAYVEGDLIFDSTFLYGMTYFGGINDMGTIFKIKPDGSNYLKLIDFAGITNGKYPHGSLISDGSFLYGITEQGGSSNNGTVFKIKKDGSTYAKLLDFAGPTNGRGPEGSLISDSSYLYGMTSVGGAYDSGTVFKIKKDGSVYAKLLDFAGPTNGSRPEGSLFFDGNFLYGTTQLGGINDGGTVFKIMPDGSGYTNLYNFTGATNGNEPIGSLISDGIFLYGTTSGGGTNNGGTIFKIKPDGSCYVKLFDFVGASNGYYPMGSLITDSTFLYGMTYMGGANNDGTVFEIRPDGSGYIKLLDFAGAATGSWARGSLISDNNFLYGMTWQGGIYGYGVVFKLGIKLYTEIIDVNENIGIAVYPDPATNYITIESPQKSEIKISNIEGQIMKTICNNDNTTMVDLKDLSSGVYIVTVKTDKEIVTKKIIKE